MAGGSLKLFQFIQKFYRFVGIFPSQPNEKCFSFNWRYSSFLFYFAQFIAATIAYLCIEAKFLFDFGLSIFIAIATIECFILFIIPIWEVENTAKYIQTCEEFIEKRKYSL